MVGQCLRRELVAAIDALNPGQSVPVRAPHARLYNLLVMHYMEGRTVREAARDLGEAVQLYREGVEAGERALGPSAFEEAVGHFWGFLGTRPYMRARAGLAQTLWTLGKKDEAVEHYREMLRLNPNDNQGLRNVLAACLLDLGRDEDTSALLEQYDGDCAAAWTYAAALLAFRAEGDTSRSKEKLAEDVKANAYAPAYLTGAKKMPRYLPDYIGIGDDNEAVSVASDYTSAWKSTPGALEWLRANAGKKGGASAGRRRN
jgi:tetratricopeptide (TPR) repeat protein